MPGPAILGVESSGLSVAIDLLGLAVVVLYLALIYWTYSDARRRIADPMLVGCATIAALFPFIGPLVYVILRPPETLYDVAERELEVRASEARLNELSHAHCQYCDYPIETEYVRCPNCARKLKTRCPTCARAVEPTWPMCPYCETELQGSAPRRSRRRDAQQPQDPPAEDLPAEGDGEGDAELDPAPAPATAGRARRPRRSQA